MHVGSSTRLGKGSEISTGYIFKGKHLLSIYLPFEKKLHGLIFLAITETNIFSYKPIILECNRFTATESVSFLY